MTSADDDALVRSLRDVLDPEDVAAARVVTSDVDDPGSGPTRAAVLLALRADPQASVPQTSAPIRARIDSMRVVLTQRRTDLRRHAGEVSLPGGRRDHTDATLKATAMREAHEEIGLDPGLVTLLGCLRPTETFVTNYRVTPFVGLLDADAPQLWLPSEAEVDAVIEVSLAELRASAGKGTLTRRGMTFQTDVFTIGERIIWGLTWRVLTDLLDRVDRIS